MGSRRSATLPPCRRPNCGLSTVSGRARWRSCDRSCILPAWGLRRPPTRSPGSIGKTASAARRSSNLQPPYAMTRRGLKTVSDLVSYTPLELSGIMSRRAIRDTMERLTLFGRSLQPESPRRNGFGLIERSEYLNTLSVRTPVKELRHLLGKRATSALQGAGFEAAGDILSRSLPEKLSERDRARVDGFVLEFRTSLETRRA